MYCPHCKAEYREGFTTCSDCYIALVSELPEEFEGELEEENGDQAHAEFKPVLSTYNHGDIAFIKSILDKQDINYYFKGENFHFVRSGADPAILMVQVDQVVEVQKLLKDVEIQFIMFSTSN